jgi:hypothetical protein
MPEGTIKRVSTRRWEISNVHPDHGPVNYIIIEQRTATATEYVITMRTSFATGTDLLNWLISRYGA